MKPPQKALLLIGSFKGLKSTSHSIGLYLLDKLEKQGVITSKAHIHRSMKSQEKQQELIEMIADTDLVILSCPLYIDSLPSPVIQFMELMARIGKPSRSQTFMAIVNSGFPEPSQGKTAVENLRHFAREVGFEWAGGFSIGGGGGIDGKSLEELPGFIKKTLTALNLAASSLVKGESVPEEAMALLRKPMMPRWLYILGGNFGWKQKARKNKVKGRLKDQPYARER